MKGEGEAGGALARAVRRYRVMAYVTGVVLMILCFVGIPLQVLAHNLFVVNYVGTTHGILYIIYLGTACWVTRRYINPALAAARAGQGAPIPQNPVPHNPAQQRPS